MAETARETIEDFSGGVNLHGPLRLAPNEFQSIVNMHPVATPSGGGYLQGRGGQTVYNATPLGLPIKSLYQFYKQNGVGIMLASSGTQMYKGDVGALTSIDTGYTTGQKFSFTTWTAKDKVYWINNVEVLKSYDGTTVATVGGSPPIGSQVEFFQNRLYILLKDGVRFSDLNVDDTWQAAALLNISDSRGGTGAFLKAANRVLIAGKSSGLWRLDGSPLLGSVFIEYSSVGCIAPWSADVVTILDNGQVIPVGVLFLGREGVYLTDGYNVRLISQRIDPLFTNEGGNPSGFFHNAVGKFYPRRRQYFFSFNAAGGTNDTLWVGTSLDSAAGSQVAWSNYTGFAADSFCVLEGGTDTGELRIGRADEGTVNRFDVNANLDVDIGYNCEFTTRHMAFGDPTTNKGIRWIKATFDASKAVHYFISYFERQSASGQLSEDITNVATWDSSLWDSAVWAGPTLNSARTSELSGRYGRYISIRFRNPGGFTPSDGRDFKFYHLDLTARIKNRRFHELFTLNQSA